MATETVTIQKIEYELLVKCRRIVEAEFEEEFSEEFIQAVKESEEDYKQGRYVKCNNSEETKKLFESL